jgi:bifunctional polynucleotide phosphatase/kinase
MPPVIMNIHGAEYRTKMAAFDFDWTLVSPKGGKTFPSDIDDWELLYPNIPDKLKTYYEDGYMIAIFTNQSKPWKLEQIELVAKSFNLPIFVVVATQKSDYKPNPSLFDVFLGDNELLKDESFFVGDALGRTSDFSDSDLCFANAIGIKCCSPEELFCEKKDNVLLPMIPLTQEKQIIIIVGYPGSGKSTLAKAICANDQFIHIEGDVFKTTPKMLKASLPYIQEGKSIVFDATNSSSKKRALYIDFANNYKYKIVCIHASCEQSVSYKRNLLRGEDKRVPKIAYSVYAKHFTEPTPEEGFELIIV